MWRSIMAFSSLNQPVKRDEPIMKKITASAALMAVPLMTFSLTANALQIENAKVGLLDLQTKTVQTSIAPVKYAANASCPVAGKMTACMMWGLSFDYHGLKAGEDVVCTMKVSQQVHNSDMYNREATGSSESKVTLDLSPDKSQFLAAYNLVKEPGDSGILNIDLDCKAGFATVLRTGFAVDAGSR